MAATDTRQLQLQISASAELLVRNLRQADNAVATFQRGIDTKLDVVDRRFDVLTKGFGAARGAIGSILPAAGFAGIGVAGRQFLDLAEASKQMQAQLRLATSEFGSYGQAQEDVERIAASTRIGLEASTKLYGNFLRASAPLGRTQADAATATETFARALKIGGAGAAEASSATLQFSQALASGVLRGDEFNSIAEASPRILKLLADALGIPQGQLRALAAEGKLTSDVLYNALTDRKITAGLDAEFKQLPVTMGDAMTLVRDATVKTAGAFDRGSELSTAIVQLVTDGANGMEGLAKAGEDAGQDLRATFLGLRDLFQPMENSASQSFGEIEGGIGNLREAVAALLDLLDVVPNQAVRFTNNVNATQNRLKQFVRSNAPSFIADRVAPDAPMIAEYNNGSIFRQNAARARLYQNAASTERSIANRFGGISRNADGSLNLGVRSSGLARPVSRSSVASSGGGGRASRSRAAARTEQPFKLDLPDLSEMFDPLASKEALERYKDRQSRTIKAILGDDALASLVDSYDAELASFINGKTKNAEESQPRGALVEFKSELERLTSDMNAALEGVAVNGLASIEDGFVDIITGTRSVSDAFKDMTKSIIADLLRIIIQRTILKALGGSFLGIGFADGGPVLKRAGGGPITGPGSPRSDVIPAMLSNGEYVINARATAQHRPLIEAINSGALPRFADGGMIGAVAPTVPSVAALAAAPASGTVNLRVSLTDDLDARIDNRAVGVAVEVVKIARPAIVQQATVETVAAMSQPRL